MPHPQPVAIVRGVIVPFVIVLCGGTSRRLGGVDKTRESLSGTTVLDYLLDDLPPGWPVVCVGEMRATTRSVQWCRESPAGGGPVAGIAAGLELIRDLGAATDHSLMRPTTTLRLTVMRSVSWSAETCRSPRPPCPLWWTR